jgi:uncharacterized protein (DUF433 family)
MNDYKKYITINPHIRFGKPTITGTRITVAGILQWLASGMTYEEILADYPELTQEHLRAALAFAAHREQLSRMVLTSPCPLRLRTMPSLQGGFLFYLPLQNLPCNKLGMLGEIFIQYPFNHAGIFGDECSFVFAECEDDIAVFIPSEFAVVIQHSVL